MVLLLEVAVNLIAVQLAIVRVTFAHGPYAVKCRNKKNFLLFRIRKNVKLKAIIRKARLPGTGEIQTPLNEGEAVKLMPFLFVVVEEDGLLKSPTNRKEQDLVAKIAARLKWASLATSPIQKCHLKIM